jgi:hypothetical protein
MENTTTTTGAGAIAAQILERAKLSDAYHWKASNDKAAMMVEFLGVKSIHDPLFVAMEDAVEARFHELIVADNRPVEQDWKSKYSDLLARHFEREAFLQDLAAFVSDFGNDMTVPLEKRLTMIRTTIAHDVAGILAEDPHFLPRCSGWRDAGK